MANEREQNQEITKRLDILIALALEQQSPGASVASKISRLRELGLGPADIAGIVGKPTNFVTATIAQQKKRKKTGNRG